MKPMARTFTASMSGSSEGGCSTVTTDDDLDDDACSSSLDDEQPPRNTRRQAHKTDGRPVLEKRSSWNSRRGGAFQNSLRNVVEEQDQGGTSPVAGGRDRADGRDGGEYDEDRAARQMQDIMNSSSGSKSRSKPGRFGLIKGRMRSIRSLGSRRSSGRSSSSRDDDDSAAVSMDPNNFDDSLGSGDLMGSVDIMNFGVSYRYESKRGCDSSMMSSMNSLSEQVDDDGFLGWDRSSTSMNKSIDTSKDEADGGPTTSTSREPQQQPQTWATDDTDADGPIRRSGSGSGSSILTQFKRLSFPMPMPKRNASDPTSSADHADFQVTQIQPRRRTTPNLTGGGGLASLFKRSKSESKDRHSFQINKDDAADYDIHEMRREILENNDTDRMSGTAKMFGFLDIGLQEERD